MSEISVEEKNNKWVYWAAGAAAATLSGLLLYRYVRSKSNNNANTAVISKYSKSITATRTYKLFQKIKDTFDENGPITGQIPQMVQFIQENPKKHCQEIVDLEAQIYFFKVLGSYEPELRGKTPSVKDFEIIKECIDFAHALSLTESGLNSIMKTNFLLTDLFHSMMEYTDVASKVKVLEIIISLLRSGEDGVLAFSNCVEYYLFIRREKFCLELFVRSFIQKFTENISHDVNSSLPFAEKVAEFIECLVNAQNNNNDNAAAEKQNELKEVNFLECLNSSNIADSLRDFYSSLEIENFKVRIEKLTQLITSKASNISPNQYRSIDVTDEDRRFAMLTQRWSRYSGCLWTVTPATFPASMKKYTLEEQQNAAKTVRRLSNESKIGDEKRVRDINREIAAICCGVEKGFFGGLLHTAGMFQATKEFIDKALSYDSSLNDDDIHKAGRNFWTCVSLQLVILRVKIECQSALLGYSLLYPYTDDYLDDNEVTSEQKREFNRKFRNWLAGTGNDLPSNALETKVHQMVKFIEEQWSRNEYPNVYYSLLSIQDAQVKSMSLHGGKANDEEIFELSVEKGGCSVLADAWLAGGKLTDYQSVFGFHFGVALQFLDDLQDVRRDLRDNQDTIFTVALKRNDRAEFDKQAKRLIHFFNYIIHPDQNNIDPSDDEYKLRVSMVTVCYAIVLKAITKDERLFTKEFIREIEWYGPLPANSMKKIVLVKRLMTLVRKDEI